MMINGNKQNELSNSPHSPLNLRGEALESPHLR